MMLVYSGKAVAQAGLNVVKHGVFVGAEREHQQSIESVSVAGCRDSGMQ